MLVAATVFALLLSSCETKWVEKVELIPLAENVEIGNGSFPLSDLQTMQVPDEWKPVAELFADDLRNTVSQSVQLADAEASLTVVKDEALPAEAYRLDIAKDGIRIAAVDIRGLNHALASLHQLVMTARDNRLPVLVLQDKPLFGYRGLMLDCARHFWTVDELKETLDHMAFFKLNTLHLHLTDNQAWRLPMDNYPNLVKDGTYYYDFPELSGKYYTKDDLKEVVRYAGIRGIEVIPEVDLPGHSLALLAALPELSCRGGKFEATPEERDWSDRKRAGENMICIGNPKSLTFAEEVVDALIEIFPSPYIHLGGDEVSTDIWETCPKCMALYRQMGMKSMGEIQDYFTRKLSELVRSKGKTMIGWGEINDRHAAGPEDVLTIWRDNGVEKQKAALERGIPVIMCPQHGCYYDWGYAGNSTRKVYEWNPVSEGVTAEQQALIKGGQAALWTERITTMDRVEWMLYPRICALAEVLWSVPASRDWDDFYQRITAYYPVMKTLGINYYEDDAMNEKEFVPSQEKPALVRNARIDTNIPANAPYHAEYAFDGKSNTFFWGGTSVGPEHYFSVILGEPLKASEVKVITGDSKDYITMGDLLVSEDGKDFVKVGGFDELGQSQVKFDAPRTILAVKIQVTGQHTCWPIIKEIVLQ